MCASSLALDSRSACTTWRSGSPPQKQVHRSACVWFRSATASEDGAATAPGSPGPCRHRQGPPGGCRLARWCRLVWRSQGLRGCLVKRPRDCAVDPVRSAGIVQLHHDRVRRLALRERGWAARSEEFAFRCLLLFPRGVRRGDRRHSLEVSSNSPSSVSSSSGSRLNTGTTKRAL